MSSENVTPDRTPPASRPWEANIEALRPLNPAMAERLTNSSPHDQWQRRTARDGAASFILPARDDQPARWLGDSCVPRDAAKAIVEGIKLPVAGTFCLDGGGGGYEIHQLLARLGPGRCLVATCESEQQVTLWLRLHDWAGYLSDNRLLLFAGKDRWKQTAWFFSEHHGFEPPSSVASWPTVENVKRNEARRECRAINDETIRERAKQIESLQNRLATRQQAASAHHNLSVLVSDPPAGAILLTTGGRTREARRFSRLLKTTFRQSGAEVRTVAMDSPATASGLPLAVAILDTDPAAAVLIDRLRSEAGSLLPANLPTLSWLISPRDAESDPKTIIERIGKTDVLACGDAKMLINLRKAGLPTDRGLYCPPVADPTLLEVPLDARREGVAIVGDVAAGDPAAFGIMLPSLQALWKTLCEEIATRWIPYSDDQFPTFCRRAQRRVNVQLEDGSPAAENFSRILRRIAADNQLLIGAATDLAKRNVPLRLYGTGWSLIESLTAHVRGPANESGRLDAITQSAVLLHLSTSTNATDLIADAAAAGCAVIVKPLPSDPSDHGVSSLLHIGSACQSIQDIPGLLRTIERLTSNPATRLKQTTAARAAIEHHGLIPHRLATLRRFLTTSA